MSELSDLNRLNELEATKKRLCELRDKRIADGKRIIEHANSEFDRDLLPIGREINRLRAKLSLLPSPYKHPGNPRKRKSSRFTEAAGFTPEEIRIAEYLLRGK